MLRMFSRATTWRLLTATAATAFLMTSASTVLRGQGAGGTTGFGPSVWDGAYTTAQAARGQAAFEKNCAMCHGPNLEGGEGPALSGDRFWADWRESTVDYLLSQISKNMPYDDDGKLAGTLPAPMYADIVGYILSRQGFPSGSAELTAQTAQGVQIIRREGPADLPASTLVHVVGCLEVSGSNYKLVQTTRPTRVTGKVNTEADKTVALGTKEFPLKFVLTPLTRYKGYRMSATGSLVGEGGSDGISIDTIRPVAETCQ